LSLCPFWPSYVPFQGVMLCENDQKLLKINISCMFWPSNVCIFLNYIFLWNMFSRAHFQHFIVIFPYFAPFQGVMLCKNGPKILKNQHFLHFLPNIVWKLFYYIILWHLFTRAYFQHFSSFCHSGRGGGPSQGVLVIIISIYLTGCHVCFSTPVDYKQVGWYTFVQNKYRKTDLKLLSYIGKYIYILLNKLFTN